MLSLKQCLSRSLWIYVCTILVGTAIAAFLLSSFSPEGGGHLAFLSYFVFGLLVTGVCSLPVLVLSTFLTRYIYNRYKGNISKYTLLQIGIVLLSFLPVLIYATAFVSDDFYRAEFKVEITLLMAVVPYFISAFLFTYGVHKHFDEELKQSSMNSNTEQDVLDDNFMNN